MFYKKAFYYFITFFISVVVAMATVIYISDPYQLFHKRFWKQDYTYSDFRVQDYATIKYNEFDSIILGTSMLENTSAYEANKILGGKWLNLSFSGQKSFERFNVLRYALQTHKLDGVIMSVDEHSFVTNTKGANFEPLLYQDDFFTKWKIYLKTNALSCVFMARYCDLRNIDINDRPNEWMSSVGNQKRFGGFENWIKMGKGNEQLEHVFKKILSNSVECDASSDDYKVALEQELLSILDKNPDTNFYLIIPPYSALLWAIDFDKFDCRMRPYEYLIERVHGYNNIKVYWLYDDDFVFDVKYYKDLWHYSGEINSLELNYIGKKSHIITVHNYKDKIKRFKNRVSKIDLDWYIDKINKFYAEQE